MSEQTCDTCKFWGVPKEVICGENLDQRIQAAACTRYPPTIALSVSRESPFTCFPLVAATCYCGEYVSAVTLDRDAEQVLRGLIDGVSGEQSV